VEALNKMKTQSNDYGKAANETKEIIENQNKGKEHENKNPN
jgi:hypothetical protein